MLKIDMLNEVHDVVNGDGKQAAVQVEMKTWEALLDYLEDLEDRLMVKDKLASLLQGPIKSVAISWPDANKEW